MSRPHGLRKSAVALVLVVSAAASACTRPTLISLDPPTGRSHALVTVNGTALDYSSIIWDAGAPAEHKIPGGFLGAYMFSVPDDAAPGTQHFVAVENSTGRSNPVTFSISTDAVTPFPKPRVDAVTLLGTRFDAPNQIEALLYVQGANFDVGAVVLIDGQEAATIAHKALRTKQPFLVPLSELAYPIYHYLSTVVALEPRSPGSKLRITVRNTDHQESEPCVDDDDPCTFSLPTDADVDSDGDGLLDSWETSGYDSDQDGVVDVNLPALGTDPYRRDILVQLDVMEGIHHPPTAGTFAAARAMFDSAPILNPMSKSGINLILDTSGKPCVPNPPKPPVCSFPTVIFDATEPETTSPPPASIENGEVYFSTLKASSFNKKREGIYHYGIWGISKYDHRSGESDYADDFVVAFDDGLHFPKRYQTIRSQVERLTHELGHDLGQHHGGHQIDHPDQPPNYLSVMSYTWDLRSGRSKAFRSLYPTCAPFYYGGPDEGADGSLPNGMTPENVSTVVDYSEGMAKKLVKSSDGGSLLICGHPVHWDASEEGSNSGTIEDSANWRALWFGGPQWAEAQKAQK